MKCFIFVLLVAVVAMASQSEAARDPRCLQPLQTGRCHALFYKYGFDPKANACVQFVYGGCGGNTNRFATKEYCEQVCAE